MSATVTETEKLSSVKGFAPIGGRATIKPELIKVIPGYNIRDEFDPQFGDPKDPTSDAALFASMAANGFIMDKPLTVRVINGEAYVISGHRRRDAAVSYNAMAIAHNAKVKADKAGTPLPVIKAVAVLPEARDAAGNVRDNVEMAYDVALSNTGKALSATERGALILRLRSYGETDETIAQRLGMGNKRWVADLAKLANGNPRLKKLVKTGVLMPTHGVLLPRAHGEKLGTEIAETATKIAAGKGKKSATGADIAEAEIAHGVDPKVGNKGKKAANVPARRDATGEDRLLTNARHDKESKAGMTVTVAPPKVKRDGTTIATVVGPFTLGSDLDDCFMFDASTPPVCVCQWPDLPYAQAMLRIVNQGWHAMRGSSIAPSVAGAAAPVQATKVRAVVPPEPDPAVLEADRQAASERKAKAVAEREARVGKQMAAVAAKRDADKARADDAARDMVKDKAPMKAVIARKAITAARKGKGKTAVH